MAQGEGEVQGMVQSYLVGDAPHHQRCSSNVASVHVASVNEARGGQILGGRRGQPWFEDVEGVYQSARSPQCHEVYAAQSGW